MAKITEQTAMPINDQRADSTQDQAGAAPFAQLDAIAAEEHVEQAQEQISVEQIEAQQQEGEILASAGEWRPALDLAREMLVATVPELEPVWTPSRLDKLALAIAQCDIAYGWGGAGTFMRSPLLGLAVAGAPLAVGTYKVIKPKLDAAKAQQIEAQRKAREALKPGSMTSEQLAVAPDAPAFGSGAV